MVTDWHKSVIDQDEEVIDPVHIDDAEIHLFYNYIIISFKDENSLEKFFFQILSKVLNVIFFSSELTTLLYKKMYIGFDYTSN